MGGWLQLCITLPKVIHPPISIGCGEINTPLKVLDKGIITLVSKSWGV
jgi:hypothetical protein